MKLILIILLLVLLLIIWSIFYPDSQITIRASDLRKLNNKSYHLVKTWYNNRLQTHRLRQSIVQKELLLAHSQQFTALSTNSELHELVAKAFRKLFIFQKKQKTNIIIPIGSNALANFAKDELDNCLLELLMTYYPHHHWQQLEQKRVALTNYFYLSVKQK